ncbi:hypothetical protein QBC40DRAFT_326755 [Triangularia verruculosa]|uniref:Uncharacterized protein n=1 Tax=Triangularia verruculosa TaxID=2587418 RepID=A0AAN7AVT0_9PEZI|nr:hypothetical protein QBC40DRAFT_326755 [Triangularia verruculosa]
MATNVQLNGHGPEPELSPEKLDELIKALKFVRPEVSAPKTTSAPDGDDRSDDEEEEDKLEPPDQHQVLDAMSKDGASVRSQQLYEPFTLRHYQHVADLICTEKVDRDSRGTLLHAILERPFENWKLLVKFMLDVDKNMSVSNSTATNSASKTSNLSILQRKDPNGNTCLHRAIQHPDSGLDFISYVCSVADDNDLRLAIATDNSRDQSCIHLAITQLHAEPPSPQNNKYPQQDTLKFFRLSSLHILKHLADHADGGVLGKAHITKTEDNIEDIENLPLHDLVHISLCKGLEWICPKLKDEVVCEKCAIFASNSDTYRKTYLAVVDILVKKYPDALKKLNQSNMSPFLFHRNTRDNNPATKDWGSLEFVEPSDGDLKQPEDQEKRNHTTRQRSTNEV